MVSELEILEIIRRNYKWEGPPISNDPFFGLLGIILSQHTTDKNAWQAEKMLEDKFSTPEDLILVGKNYIKNIIKTAGLQNEKSNTIINVARAEAERHAVSRALKMNWQDARKSLTNIQGIGEKTADVFCMLYLNAPIIPIDVHVKRVSYRLALSKSNNYEGIQRDLHLLVKPEYRKETHLAMIRFGREVCKSKKPLCASCPFNKVCPWYLSTIKA